MNTIKELKQKGLLLSRRITKLADTAEGKWITVRGRKVFIGKGESFDDALKKSLGREGKKAAPVARKLPRSGLGSDDAAWIKGRKPDHSINTGISSGDSRGAASLDVYYQPADGSRSARALVVPSDGKKAYIIYGKPSAKDILSHYGDTLHLKALLGDKS